MERPVGADDVIRAGWPIKIGRRFDENSPLTAE
jgi:hypothetical protein